VNLAAYYYSERELMYVHTTELKKIKFLLLSLLRKYQISNTLD
jgi:hypothetical protein